MSTILLYTSPARGHLYPMMDVALALRAAGHRVVVQTLADERGAVEAEGLEHRAISPHIERMALEDYRHANPIGQLRGTFRTWLARAPHEVEDVRRATVEVEQDLLLIDANSWGAAAFAEAQGEPWAMFLPYALPVPSPDTPVFGPGFPPPRHALHRARDRALGTLLRAVMHTPMTRLNALRADLGARPVRTHADLFLRADALLYRTAEPFEYPRRAWPASVHAIGPGTWSPPATAPSWLAELPRPRVLVSVSTEFQDDGAIIEAALQALGDMPGSAIVTTAALDPAAFASPNPRIRIERFLSHAAVIPEVDLVVTHGGMGTTQRALAAGVPVCVIPWGRDQNETAQRAVECGAGTRVSRATLTGERLRTAIRDALGKKAAAERVARAFRSAGGGARAVEVLEGLLVGARDARSVPTPVEVPRARGLGAR